jgi:pilus assembly protein Flp/PilA
VSVRSERELQRMTSVAINNEWRDVMKNLFNRFVREEQGQDLIEYALLAGFISLVAVVAITAVGTGVNGVYGSIQTKVEAIPGGS